MVELPDWYRLELDVAYLCERLQRTGVPFDVPQAQALLAQLQTDADRYASDLQTAFPPQLVEEVFIPKRNNQTKGYQAGVPFIKRKLQAFNPGSHPQVVERLIARHGWQPTVLSAGGAPSVKTAVLETLAFPEAETLIRHRTVDKRISMMTGDNGWLTLFDQSDSRLHTQYFSHGTITGRATHKPNISQVPRVLLDADKQPLIGAAGRYGYECRSLFGPRPGWLMVGADMAGLELGCLAHYLAAYDGGSYAQTVTAGDPHALTQSATGLTSRDRAKRLIYATIYGCGALTAGGIVEPDESDQYVVREIGAAARTALIDGIAGFGALFRWLDSFNSNFIPGLDGRQLQVRKKFAALNTLLQSTGAILCKRWLVLCEQAIQQAGLVHGVDYEFLIYNHDEQQWGARSVEIAEQIGQIAVEQAVAAGVHYDFACPTAGTSKIGKNWAETH